MIFENVKLICQRLEGSFEFIPPSRKEVLKKIVDYVSLKKQQNVPVQLVYICTHNSRRSHLGQIWSAVAAYYYGIENVTTYSGGTEATAFHPNAIFALKLQGFVISTEEKSSNPLYKVEFARDGYTNCFSKVYDHDLNPKSEFAAIMTCSDAEENCPFIPGVEFKIGTTYDDPKAFDGTPEESDKYQERSLQIALECLYVFSLVKKNKF
jgi:protein-tyrosine phosphatase/arsenate reductase